MSSIKWFNKNYLMQNIKKSKGVLSVILIIVPLLSALSLVLMSSTSGNRFIYSTFNELSIFAILGMYVVPIVVSIALFGFVFKRKSSDFINAMPINRSTIFVTNSIGGIILLTAMILLSTVLIIIISNFTPSIIVSKSLMIDYFIIWAVTYIFVFIATNLAASISGNMITSIAVTALLLFLAPFVVQTYNGFSQDNLVQIKCDEKACVPTSYSCYNDKTCLDAQDKGIYTNVVHYISKNTDNVPYQYASSLFLGTQNFQINFGQVGKMIILSIIYFGLGVYFFRKKHMEVTETSFNNIHVHNVVKCLTLFPMIILLGYMIAGGGGSSALFGLIVILIYYFIYDLITRKQIHKFRLSLIYFVLTVILFGGFYYITSNYELKNREQIKISDIKQVSINLDESYADTSNIYMDNETIKNLVVKNLVTKEGDNNEDANHLVASLKLNNGKTKKIEVNGIPNSDYDKIINEAYHNDKFTSTFKNVSYKDVYAIATNQIVIDPSKNKEIIEMLKKGLSDTNILDYNKMKQGFNLTLFAYKNHEQFSYTVNTAINPELTRFISKYSNNLVKENLVKKEINIDNINSIIINGHDLEIDGLTDYIINRTYPELYEFVKNNINKTCDITKDYVELVIYYKGEMYIFYTNNTEGFDKVINDKKESLKNTKEYQSMLNDYNSANKGGYNG